MKNEIKNVQTPIVEYLEKLESMKFPLYHERRQAGGFSYKKGIPDLYAVYDGIHIEIEVKDPKGKLSTMQEKWRDRCKRLNILYICAKSLDEFKEFMKDKFNLPF